MGKLETINGIENRLEQAGFVMVEDGVDECGLGWRQFELEEDGCVLVVRTGVFTPEQYEEGIDGKS